MSLRYPLVLAGFAVAIATVPAPANAQEVRTTEDILENVCSFLASQDQFKVDMEIAFDNVLDSGAKVQYSAYQTVIVDKPGRLRANYLGDTRVSDFYFDEGTFTLFSPLANAYVTKTGPTTIDEAVQAFDDKYGIVIPMSNLYVTDPCTVVLDNIDSSTFVGLDLVDREITYHILVEGKEGRDWQLWASRDPKAPVPLKIVITYKDLPGAPQYSATFKDWNFNPEITESTFTFTPNAAAIPVEFLPEE